MKEIKGPFVSALAHHWLVGERGGEKVLKILCELFPDTPVYTLVRRRSFYPPWLVHHQVFESGFRFMPFSSKYFRALLMFFPWFIASIPKVRGRTSILISSDASMIKGLTCEDGVIHICYCHSPPRYLWEMQDVYFSSGLFRGIKKRLFGVFASSLRKYDKSAAKGVTHFIANSEFVAERIKKYYGRDAIVIHPPVELENFKFSPVKKNYFLVVSEMVPYKRIDLVLLAFSKISDQLIVVGSGSEQKKLQAMASSNVTFVGRVNLKDLVQYYSDARAFIFPGIEDFGITPIEAQASGTPVIAFKKGGCLETVIDGVTGVFFEQQTPDSLLNAIRDFKESNISPIKCLENSKNFSKELFKKKVGSFLNSSTADNET